LRVNDRKKETFEITGQKTFQEQEKQEIEKKKRISFRLNDLLKHKGILKYKNLFFNTKIWMEFFVFFLYIYKIFLQILNNNDLLLIFYIIEGNFITYRLNISYQS
jgi:hypothetical protein